jgi:5-methylcytosine-specific restriction endonuclease McrA
MIKTDWVKLQNRICCLCGVRIIHRPKEKYFQYKKRKYCSIKCKMKALAKMATGKKAHNNIQVPKECIFCHNVKRVAPCLKDRPFCSRICMAKWMSENKRGKNHWHWMGGITEKPSRDVLYPGYKEWRKQVYMREGFKCVLCGNSKSGELQAHHIKPRATYKELILDISNGICVCKKCHKEIHYGKKV